MSKNKLFFYYITTPISFFSIFDFLCFLSLIPFIIGWGLGIKTSIEVGLTYGCYGLIMTFPVCLTILFKELKSIFNGDKHVV